MIPSVLFGPMLAGVVVLSPTAAPNQTPEESTAFLVVNKEDPGVPVGGDELERLRGHLHSLSDSLSQTQKAVDAVARQRDEARAKAAKSHEKLDEARKTLKGVQGKLEKAQAEASAWKEKAQMAQMTHEDLKKFRGDLKGAMAEFAHLKGDFAKARTELSDPIARVEMKKAMEGVKKEHQNLKRDIEIAIKARTASDEATAKMQKELEKSREEAKRLESALAKKEKESFRFDARLAEAMVLNQKNVAKLGVTQGKLVKAEEFVATLRGEKESVAKSLAAMKDLGMKTTEMKTRMKELEGRLAELNVKWKAAEGGKAALQARSEVMAARLQERDKELAQARATLKEREAAMAAIPKVDPAVAAELKSSKIELARSQSELSFLQKSKSQMERKLVQQGTEIRELKGRLRKSEEKQEAEEAKAESSVEGALGAHPIPRAIIIYEG